MRLQTSAPGKTLSREWEDKPSAARQYLQKTHLIKPWFPKICKDIERKDTASLILRRLGGLRKIYARANKHVECAPLHGSPGKCRLKLDTPALP